MVNFMKQLIVSIAIILSSAYSFAQQLPLSKEDSIAIVEQNKKIIKIVSETTIKEFNEWIYKNLTADKYNEFFAQWYNAFVSYKLSLLPKEDKTKKTTK